MEQVIVAFENETSCKRIRDLLEGAGAASCIVCRTAGQVRRAAGMCPLVVCGYKFPDGTAEDLFEDLPPACAMLLVAKQSLLDLCRSEGMFRLAAPVAKGDLLASVRMLLQMGGEAGGIRPPSQPLPGGRGGPGPGQGGAHGPPRYDRGTGPPFSPEKEYGQRLPAGTDGPSGAGKPLTPAGR